MNKSSLLIVFAALALTGCEKSPGSVGVTVSSDQTQSQDQVLNVGKDKNLSQAEKASATVKMSGSILLAQAVSEYLSEQGYRPPYRVRFLGASSLGSVSRKSSKTPEHDAAAIALAASFEPALGWPDVDEGLFMRRSAAVAGFANMIGGEVLGRIGDQALKDPAAAKMEIIRGLGQIPSELMSQIWSDQVKQSAGSKFIQNAAGSSAPIEFRDATRTITIGAQGMTLAQGGAIQFGDGKFVGKSVELSMETSLSATRSQKYSLDMKESDRASQGTKVEAGLKSQ